MALIRQVGCNSIEGLIDSAKSAFHLH